MDKKSLLAVVLVMLVIMITMMIQSNLFSGNQNTVSSQNTETTVQENTTAAEYDASAEAQEIAAAEEQGIVAITTTQKSSEKFYFETDFYQIEFDPAGASISSLMLKNHKSADGEQIDMIFKGENGHNAFLLYWGDDYKNPILDTFSYTVEGMKVIFSNEYKDAYGNRFTLIKTYEFKNGEYLFAVTVDIVGDSNFKGIGENGYAYTLSFEPQVGPSFTQMKNNNYDYRRVYIEGHNKNGKLKKSLVKFNNGSYYTLDTLKWFSVTSKYFTVVGMAKDTNTLYKYFAIETKGGEIAQTDSLYFARPETYSSSSDTIYFYAGPQLKQYIGTYYSGMNNSWGLSDTYLENAMESGSVFGWLENILKWMLTMLYKVIPNYGVGIILLTIIIKILLWPLSRKSAASTAKMSALQPKMQELQAKYKDNPQRLNQETAELYKREGVSPLGGCLPMLLQFPILIAMYGLLNKHFELRGAMFIPGWIPDLSVPETVLTLGFNIPLLGNEIHLLPILYTVSMIFSMKITQMQSTSPSQGKGMQFFMMYGMPILFFFVLYSAPSGLLLYWMAQNLLSMGQQFYTNNKLKKNPHAFDKKGQASEEKVPEAIKRYQERLKKAAEIQAAAKKKKKK